MIKMLQATDAHIGNLSLDELERISGGNTWLLLGATRVSSGPHRQPIDPNPSTGTGYGGDSAGGSGGGGYFGDTNAPGLRQF
jgi:peptidase E